MRVIQRWAVLGTMVLAAMALMLLTRCSEPPQEELELEVAHPVEVTTEAIEPEPVELEPPSADDIREEILDGWDGEWPTKAKRQTIDVSVQILRLAEEEEVDPIIIADEYVELFSTTVEMQPAFAKNWDGGIARALLVSLDMYRAARIVRGRTCHEIDAERFPEEIDEQQVPPVSEYVLLSMGYRESSLAKRVEIGEKLGSAGERGMFQFRPGSNGQKGFIEARFMPRYRRDGSKRRCSPFDRMCATLGAANALGWIRCECIRLYGERCNVDTYVAGYGMNRIPDPAGARHSRGPRNARRYLESVRPDDVDELWPRSWSEGVPIGE